jgi:hypothetical protein
MAAEILHPIYTPAAAFRQRVFPAGLYLLLSVTQRPAILTKIHPFRQYSALPEGGIGLPVTGVKSLTNTKSFDKTSLTNKTPFRILKGARHLLIETLGGE